MANTAVKTMLVHPATRSTNFVDKSFTENIITNIIRVASFKDKFVIDDDTKSIIESGEISGSEAVLKMVINGYYVEVPISELVKDARYFYLNIEDLDASKESGFAGVKELKAIEQNGSQYFVHMCDTAGLTEAGLSGEDKYVIDVFPYGYNNEKGDIFSQINIDLRKSFFTQFFVVQSEAPANKKVLWINSSKYYVMNVYVEEKGWVEIGAVYKSTSIT